MDKRKLLLGALVVSAIGAIPVTASAAFGVYVDVAPPAPRAGYTWAPGYWDYRGGHYHWVGGHYIREHRGEYWHPDRWEQRDGRWMLQRGSWNKERWEGEHVAQRDREHDRDHDGTPDRYDRAPDNPHRQ